MWLPENLRLSLWLAFYFYWMALLLVKMRKQQRRKWTLCHDTFWVLNSGFSLFALAGCWPGGLCYYEQTESVLLFLSICYLPSIFWTYTSALGQSELALPSFRWDTSLTPLDISVFLSINFLCNTFHFLFSWALAHLA